MDEKGVDDIEVVIGDNSDLTFSEVENFVEELKPKVNKNKNTKIIMPVVKSKKEKKDDDDKKDDENK